jgi:hypothetical protein
VVQTDTHTTVALVQERVHILDFETFLVDIYIYSLDKTSILNIINKIEAMGYWCHLKEVLELNLILPLPSYI